MHNSNPPSRTSEANPVPSAWLARDRLRQGKELKPSALHSNHTITDTLNRLRFVHRLLLQGRHLLVAILHLLLHLQNLLLFLIFSSHNYLHHLQFLQLRLATGLQVNKRLLLVLCLLLVLDDLLLHPHDIAQDGSTVHNTSISYLEHATFSSSVSSGSTISIEYTTFFSRIQEYVLSQMKKYSPASSNTILPCCGQSGG